MFLVNFQRVACPQRERASRSAFLTNTFLFRVIGRPECNEKESIERSPHAATIGKKAGSGYGDGEAGRTTKDRVMQAERIQQSGARRTGQPRPGAPGSRPRIGSAAIFFCSSLRLLSGSLHFFPRRVGPLSAQFGRSKTFAVAPRPLYRRFGNSLSECLR
ncbi:hypothetical protein DF153_04865 [Burkholderia cenocepacia]|nr:hypothetical protein DF152_15880 [Burkholderia cenocepacia]RQU28419.1 hypothetical protein DF153_04865 [Burkholderia cenocepacia]